MLYSEANLLKLLEYGKLSLHSLCESIARAMDLEFYSEANSPVHTICSNAFVLDITEEGCSLLFVEDEHNTQFLYVQEYLNAYFSDRVAFYHLLKFFTRVVSLDSGQDSQRCDKNISGRLDRHKNICECVFTDQYCYTGQKTVFPVGYNIYTHRTEHTHFDPILSFPSDIDTDTGIDFPCNGTVYKLSPNLCSYFREDAFSIRVFDQLPQSDLYYYERDGIRVVNGDVYVENRKCGVASFIFKKGCSLGEALAFSAKIRGI